jgi:hypothetical protein
MFMDDNNQPVSLKRLFTIVKENTKQTALVINEDMMLPSEIMISTELMIKNCPIKNVSSKFIGQFRDFLHGIAREVAKVRQSIGTKDDLLNPMSEADLKKERKDVLV